MGEKILKPSYTFDVEDCAGTIPVTEEIFNVLKSKQGRVMYKRSDDVYCILSEDVRQQYAKKIAKHVGPEWLQTVLDVHKDKSFPSYRPYTNTSYLRIDAYTVTPQCERMLSGLMRSSFKVNIYV